MPDLKLDNKETVTLREILDTGEWKLGLARAGVKHIEVAKLRERATRVFNRHYRPFKTYAM